MSDIYKSRHPDVVRRVEGATGRRFMSDDLPHLLLGVSGIETVWYDSRRDLLSPDFNVDRKRVFGY
jgi:heptose-I-phosphate ethanolaminephosphotransferase